MKSRVTELLWYDLDHRQCLTVPFELWVLAHLIGLNKNRRTKEANVL